MEKYVSKALTGRANVRWMGPVTGRWASMWRRKLEGQTATRRSSLLAPLSLPSAAATLRDEERNIIIITPLQWVKVVEPRPNYSWRSLDAIEPADQPRRASGDDRPNRGLTITTMACT
mmetsp:Transcript_61011/g.128944  ORF Transcript_61011/g.128944 Transcript_61011/m.128944 type:complete len:118 (-) Transcript_61011:88-441(-)